MKNLAIIGGDAFFGQLARVLAADFKDQYRLIGAVDDTKEAETPLAGDMRTLGGWGAFTERYRADEALLALGVGYRDLEARKRAFDRVRAAGYRFATLVSPQAIVSREASVLEGAIVMAGAVIDVGATVEAGAFIDIGVNVCENVRIGTASYVSAGAAVGGRCQIGAANFLGLNAVVVDGVSTGDFVRIQAGALLHRDAPARSTVMEARNVRIIPCADSNSDQAA